MTLKFKTTTRSQVFDRLLYLLMKTKTPSVKEIMALLHCSRRTAVDYHKRLKILKSLFSEVK
jgi:hypothetical protein